MSPGSASPPATNGSTLAADAANPSAGPLPGTSEKPKRKRRRTPYSKRSWQEQMEILDQEAERARRQDEQEEARLRRLKPGDVMPKAPRNTTQFLIDSHASDNEDSLKDGDEIEIDEHGTMTDQSSELLAIREELRKKQREEEEVASMNTV
jgi:hypothetical protein